MQVCFTSNSDDGARWAWTEGLRALDQPQAELGALLPWAAEDDRDAQVERLLAFLTRYVARHGKPILAGQTIRYGWTLLRAEPGAPGPDQTERLKMQELSQPFAEQTSSFTDGVTAAVALLALQEAAIARIRITGTAEHPHRHDSAIVCARVDQRGGTPLTLTRLSLTDRRIHDSGWFAGCQDRDHNHDDPHELHSAHLVHLVASYPWIFPYLGMPTQTRIALDGVSVVVWRPNERHGAIDDAPPFTLPFSTA